MALFNKQRIGIDLGTSTTLIYIENKGIALREPSIIAKNIETQEVVAYGKQAELLLGRTSDHFDIVYPIKDGVIYDFTMTKKMLAHYVKLAMAQGVSKPEVVISVPSNISKVERRALIDALKDLGIARAMIVDEVFAAAIGANLNINEARGHLVIDMGGGTTNIATISFGEIVHVLTSKASGNLMNQHIMAHVREQYKVIISMKDAELLKTAIGSAKYYKEDEVDSVTVTGRHVGTGLPTKIDVTAIVVAKAIDEVIVQLVADIKQILEQTAPELSSDILEEGVILTGGSALLKRISERLFDDIHIPVHVANHPIDCVVIGTGKLLKNMSLQSKQIEKRLR